MGDTTASPSAATPGLNRAGRREQERQGRRLRKTGAALAAIPAAFGTTAVVLGAASGPAGAIVQTWTVTKLADTNDGTCDSDCSLREALANANDGDTIDFTPGLTGTSNLTGQLDVTASVTISGPGPSVITLDAGHADRIFNVSTEGGANGSFTVSGLTLANGKDSGGGAINDANEDITVSDVVFTGNSSTGAGGAIHSATTDPAIDIEIRDSTFTGNTADGYGGAMKFKQGGTLLVDNTTFDQNLAKGGAGALYVTYFEGPVTITNSHFTHNTAQVNGGGAMDLWYSSDADVMIDNSEFTDNFAGSSGGAVYFYDLGSITITNSDISNNVGDYGGGFRASYHTTRDFTLRNTMVTGNTGASGDSGGFYLSYVEGDVVIDQATITGNHATDGGGGGAWIQHVYGANGVSVSSSTISGNTAADGDGGGLYAGYVDGDVAITFTTIAGNSAAQEGGGILTYKDHDVRIENSTVSGNTATSDGGGVYAASYNYGLMSLFNSTISGNSSSSEGGGIFLASYGGLDLVQTTITDNTATTVGGVAIFDWSLHLGAAQHDDKGADHHRAQGAGGVAPDRAARAHARSGVRPASFDPVTSSGSIIAANHGFDVGEDGVLQAKSSLLGSIQGTTLTDQGGNLKGVDPLLGPLQDNGGPTQTHALLPGSPAIDAGPNPLTPFPGSDFDQRGAGYDRVVAGVVDIGAFEVQPVQIQPTFTG